MKITDEMVEKAAETFDQVYSAQIEPGAIGWTDNNLLAMRAALQAVADDIAAAENEACAKIADYLATELDHDETLDRLDVGMAIAYAIRARRT